MTDSDVKSKAITGTIWKFLERFLAQGITLVVSLIIARIVTPSEYGAVGLVTIFFAFANVIISGGLNTALIQKKDADATDYSSVLWVSLGISVFIYFVLFLIAPFVAEAYRIDVLVSVIRVMGLSLPIYALKSIVCAYISATLQFRKFFFATLGGTVISAIVGITMAIKGYGVWALVAQQITNTTIDTLILLLSTRMPVQFRVSIQKLGGLLKYGWKILVSSLINTLYNEFNPLFIGLRFSSADLSFYTKGKMFPSTLSTTITNTFSSVLFPVMAKYQDDRERILNYTRLYMRISSFCVFPALLGLFAVSRNLIHVVLTDKWLNAVGFLRIFCIALMFDVIAVGNCESIKAIGRSDVFLRMEIVKKVGYFITLALFLVFAKTPKQLAYSSIVCMLIQITVNSIPNRKLIGYTLGQQIIDLLPNLICSVIMCGAVIAVGMVELSSWLVLILQIITGVGVYLLLGVITRNKSLKYFSNMLFKKRVV